MAAKAGSLVLIKIGDGEVSESFTTIGGLRASSIMINNQILESTHLDSGEWKQITGGIGIKAITLSGRGIFTDSGSEGLMRQQAFANTINNYQFYFSNGDYLTGPFIVSGYERHGDYDKEQTYSMVLESAGPISFSAA
jgi:TP901-1 family phage major tail protein